MISILSIRLALNEGTNFILEEFEGEGVKIRNEEIHFLGLDGLENARREEKEKSARSWIIIDRNFKM